VVVVVVRVAVTGHHREHNLAVLVHFDNAAEAFSPTTVLPFAKRCRNRHRRLLVLGLVLENHLVVAGDSVMLPSANSTLPSGNSHASCMLPALFSHTRRLRRQQDHASAPVARPGVELTLDAAAHAAPADNTTAPESLHVSHPLFAGTTRPACLTLQLNAPPDERRDVEVLSVENRGFEFWNLPRPVAP
jgi:hypothetical protein